MVLEQKQEDMATTTMTPAVQDNQQEEQASHLGVQKRRSSYRILGTFTPQLNAQTSGSNETTSSGVDEDDPMAWADLEAFGGTKKTLEKEVVVRKELTPEEVREQLRELHEIDNKMAEAAMEKRSKQGMLDTITWLKQRSQSEDAAEEKQNRKRTSSIVRSVLDFFRMGSRTEDHEQHHDNNNESIRTENAEDDEEPFQKLEVPWGQSSLSCDWSQVGFRLLNQAIVEDIGRVRHVIENGELQTASPQAIIALAKWLRLFDQHVDYVESLKQYLLEERTVLTGVGYKVTTIYDVYRESLEHAIALIHGDRVELGTALLQMFTSLEAILRDEMLAVQDVVTQTLTEEQEYVAISELFHHLGVDEACGVIVAKLLGWMKNHLNEEEVQAFLALFDADIRDHIAGEWMRHYASYLHHLDEFSLNYESSLAFFT